MDHPARQPSRRDLLGARLPGGEGSESNDFVPDNFGPLFHFSSNAMGCQFQVLCAAEGRQALAKAVADGFDLIEHLEQQLSIYRQSSEMSGINRDAFRSDVSVEPSLFELLRLACRMSEATQGAFDITAAPLTRLWKAHRTDRTLPGETEVTTILNQVGFQHLQLEETTQTIRFARENLMIDLGGIGKGYALDRLKEHLSTAGCNDFLIHGGQSSVIGCGMRSDPTGVRHPWQVSISHPLTPGLRLATLAISDRALGTSGSGRQHFVVDGKRFGHIIDPRSGWPADKLLSVTVIADSAVLADALATAIFVAGPEQAQKICDHFEVAAVLVSNEGKIVSTINLDDSEIRLEPSKG